MPRLFEFDAASLASNQSPTPNNAIKCQSNRLSHWSAQMMLVFLYYVQWENSDSVDHIRCRLLARVLHVKYSIWEMLSPQVTLGSQAFVCQHQHTLHLKLQFMCLKPFLCPLLEKFNHSGWR